MEGCAVTIRPLIAFASCLALVGLSPALAVAQHRSPSTDAPIVAAQPAVEGFVLERVSRLTPGETLAFSVFGTERSEVTVYVEGVSELVDLQEVQPGIYEGSHVLGAKDKPRTDSEVVATMQRGGRVTRATLGGPLVIASAPLPWADARERSTAAPPAERRPVPATVSATPQWPGVMNAVAPTDRPADASRNERTARTARCADCAVVQSIRVVDAEDRSALSRAFDSHRRRMLGLLDAAGVPFAARERQRIAPEGSSAYEVLLRRPDGRVEVRRYLTQPGFETGDTVRLTDDDGERAPIPGA